MGEPARRALLIATSRYRDRSLPDLSGATNDAAELASVLADDAVGGFDVHTVVDRASYEVAAAIEAFLQGRGVRDLVLLYFTGHGIKGIDGNLYFAAANTDASKLRSSAIAAAWVNETLDACRSRRQMVLLDCCHSGAFAKGIKAGGQVGSTQLLSGRGRVILTASDSIQFALERPDADDLVKSVFTTCLVRGLRTGEADVDGDGQVTLEDLFEYVQDAVHRENPQQTPEMTAVGLRGEFVIARNPHAPARPSLPPGLSDAVVDPAVHTREHAVAQLGELLSRTDDPQLRQAVLQALQLLRADDSRLVSGAASAALRDTTPLGVPRRRVPAGRARPAAAPVARIRRLIWATAGLITVITVALLAPRLSGRGQPQQDPPRTFAVDDLLWSETAPTDGDAVGGRINAITWYEDAFVAVGEQRRDDHSNALVWTSFDGQEWRPVEDGALRADGDQSMYGIAEGPEGIVAVGTDGARPDQDAAVWVTSDEAIRRVEPDASLTQDHREMRAVVWHDGRFVAVGCVDVPRDNVCDLTEDGSQRAAIWSSADGRAWEEVPTDQIEGAEQTAMRDIAVTQGGALVAVGHQQSAGQATRRAAIWASSDAGRSWERATVPQRQNSMQQSILQVAARDDGVVAVGYDMVADNDRDAAVWYSPDGWAWRQVLPNDHVPMHQVMEGVTAAGDGFVGVGRYHRDGATHGAIWASADGMTWRLYQPDAFPGDETVLRAAAGSDDRVVAGGATGGSQQVGEARLWLATAHE